MPRRNVPMTSLDIAKLEHVEGKPFFQDHRERWQDTAVACGG